VPFTMKQNDTSPVVHATLQDGEGVAVDLTGSTVMFHMINAADGTVKIDGPTVITEPTNGIVWYHWLTGDTDTPGTFYVEFEVTYPSGSIETFPNNKDLTVIVKPELS